MNTKTEATITTPGSFDDADQEALVLSEAAQLLNRATEPESSITAVLRLLSQLVGLNRGRVVLPRSSDGHLAIHYAYGLRAEEKERGVYAPGEGITGQVMATGRVCVVQDIDSESDFLFRAVDRATLPPETVCFIAVPILRDNEPVGVLGFHRLRNRPRAFQADIRLLRIIAAMIGQTLRIDELIRQRTQHLEDQNRALRSALERQTTRHGIVGESRAIREALDQATQVAGSDATVMLSGESGTGKEKFARLIHSHSARASAPFVCINCAAIPEQLLEAEIFGNERGAFTGAVRSRSGKAEAAHGGTLFLDEIGDMSQDLQVKLLRLLQERTVQRVGGDRDIHVDIRVITATHKDLQEAVNQGTFRLDLYYRLNVIPLRLPALRERAGDISELAREFLNAFNHRHRRSLTLGSGVLARLESFSWPGNIRQLENVMERAVLTARGTTIEAADIERILGEESSVIDQRGTTATPTTATTQETAQASPAPPTGATAPAPRPYQRVADSDAAMLQAALQRTRGNKTQAARELGLTPRQFQYRLNKLGLR